MTGESGRHWGKSLSMQKKQDLGPAFFLRFSPSEGFIVHTVALRFI